MVTAQLDRQITAEHIAETYRNDAEANLAEALSAYLEHFTLWDLQKALIAQLSKIALPSGRSQKTNVSFRDLTTGEYL